MALLTPVGSFNASSSNKKPKKPMSSSGVRSLRTITPGHNSSSTVNRKSKVATGRSIGRKNFEFGKPARGLGEFDMSLQDEEQVSMRSLTPGVDFHDSQFNDSYEIDAQRSANTASVAAASASSLGNSSGATLVSQRPAVGRGPTIKPRKSGRKLRPVKTSGESIKIDTGLPSLTINADDHHNSGRRGSGLTKTSGRSKPRAMASARTLELVNESKSRSPKGKKKIIQASNMLKVPSSTTHKGQSKLKMTINQQKALERRASLGH